MTSPAQDVGHGQAYEAGARLFMNADRCVGAVDTDRPQPQLARSGLETGARELVCVAIDVRVPGGLSAPLERRVAAAHLGHKCHDRGPQGGELAMSYRAHIEPDDARVRAVHDDNPVGANARTRRHAGLVGSTTVCPIPHVSSTLGATADFLCAGFDHNGATASRVLWAHVHDAFPATDGIPRGVRGGYEARLDREDD